MNKRQLEKELNRITRQEYAMLLRSKHKKAAPMESLVGNKVPEGLADTLDAAFEKAFKVVFDKGTAVINMTFNEKKINQAEDSGRESQRRWIADMALTSVEGAGLGLLGIGIPDIPVFTGMILRSVYQTALCYNFDYNSTKEQIFILKVIEAALARGEAVEPLNQQVDAFMQAIDNDEMVFFGLVNEQIERTAKALSNEVLYMKFIQTVPIIGAAGGMYNPFCLHKVKNYADLKYQKREVMKKIIDLEKKEREKLEENTDWNTQKTEENI